MPTLNKYKDGSGYYARTRIKNSVATFQLTRKGRNKLLENDINDGDTFSRKVLFDLYRKGMAYTGGTGLHSSDVDTGQLPLDFKDDPIEESGLPSCDCGSVKELSLTMEESNGEIIADIKCKDCKETSNLESFMLLRFLGEDSIFRITDYADKISDNLTKYKKSLGATTDELWERHKKPTQDKLIDKEDDGLF